MATITKKKALSNFQGADQANDLNQQNLGLIRDTKVNPFTAPTTPKLDTNSVIASQLNTPADIFKKKYANQGMTTPVSTTPATPAVSTPASPITQVDQTGKNTDILYQNNIPKGGTIDSLIAGLESKPTTTQTTTSGPTNQQNMDALTTNMATVAENAKKASDETKSALKYGAQQRDYQQEGIKSQADTSQVRMDRQMADQTLQVDRAIADTDRISKRNIAMLEKVAALQGTGKSSGFGQGILNLKEDTIRTINRLKEDLDRAKTATGEEAKLLWENYNRNKEKIDNDFEYQFRDFTNRQTASIAELTTAGYDPVKVNKALDKIYEEAQYKTQELFTNYVNNYQTLNNETRLQSQEIRTQKEFDNSIQKEFISQYIGYNGEKLGSQTIQSLKGYLDNGQISQNDYDLYTQMIGDNTIATLQKYGTVTQDDLTNIEQLLTKGYTPTEAVAYMIQSNPTRFTTQESKTPNIQTYEVNGEKYSGYFDQSGNFVNMSSPAGTGGATGDLRGLASQFPGQAWAKNNNPAGITWNANFDNITPGSTADLLTQAGIQFSKGTSRPSAEGGNYVTFNTIEDGLAAQRILMEKTYGNKTVNQMLQSWVGTSNGPQYAQSIAFKAGVDLNMVVNQLSPEQLDTLQMAKIQRESPGLYKLLNQAPQGPKEYTESQQNMMRQMDAKNISSTEKTMLKKAGLTEEDVYNYKNSRTSDRRQNGLNDDEIKRVNLMADDFYGTPTAKTFNKIQEAYKFADSIKGGVKATDNQALIYAFAKAMDPDSVVREGEYSTVQKYSQTWGDKLGMDINRVLNGQEFISEKAKNNIVSTIKSKYDATKSQYEQERKTYINRINDYAGNDIGGKVIPSNATETTQQQSNIPASLANPSSGVVSQAAKNLLNDL